MSTLGIIGHGYVGKSVEYGFNGYDKEKGLEPKHQIVLYDKYKKIGSLKEISEKSEFIFACLPTPYYEDELRIDLSIYDEVMAELCPMIKNKGKIVVIKSTVVPGTTKRYANLYPNVFFSMNPEFLTEANYLQDFINPDRIVIGSDNDWISQKMIDLYRTCFPSVSIIKMSSAAAEIVKYQSNVLLATKVSIANVFYDMCQKLDVCYEDVKKGVTADKRIGTAHLNITSERGFGGKCFVKDLGAIIGRCRELKVDCKLLEEVNNYNLRIRKVKDWREIAGATVGGRIYCE